MQTYILQIETSTSVCAVALVASGQVCQSLSLDEPNVHASQLTVIIRSLLEKEQIGFDKLAAVAVSMGPGSYTGLRIGVSTAKGLCYALGVPLIAVNTLDGLYEGFRAKVQNGVSAELYIPMLDARRREVYCEVFTSKGEIIQPTQAQIIDENSFDHYLNDYNSICIFGPGADKFVDTFADTAQITVVPHIKTDAVDLTRIADAKYHAQDFEDLAYFEPFYLKDFVALQPKNKKAP